MFPPCTYIRRKQRFLLQLTWTPQHNALIYSSHAIASLCVRADGAGPLEHFLNFLRSSDFCSRHCELRLLDLRNWAAVSFLVMRESDLAIFISLMAASGDATVIYLLLRALVIQHDADKYLFLDCCDWESSLAVCTPRVVLMAKLS